MKKILPWLPSLCWMAIIFYLSGRTGSQLSSIFPFLSDFNWGHFLAFFILSVLYYYALAKTTSLRSIPFWTVFLCLLYGLTDEYHQSFVPSRTPELSDIANDIIGAALGAAVIHLYMKKHRRVKKAGKNYN